MERLRWVLVEPKPSVPLLWVPLLDEAVFEPKSMREALLLSVGVCIIGLGLFEGSVYTSILETGFVSKDELGDVLVSTIVLFTSAEFIKCRWTASPLAEM